MLFAQDLAQGVIDRFDRPDSRVIRQGKLDGPIYGPDLCGGLGLGDGGQDLVGRRGKILNQFQTF